MLTLEVEHRHEADAVSPRGPWWSGQHCQMQILLFLQSRLTVHFARRSNVNADAFGRGTMASSSSEGIARKIGGGGSREVRGHCVFDKICGANFEFDERLHAPKRRERAKSSLDV